MQRLGGMIAAGALCVLAGAVQAQTCEAPNEVINGTCYFAEEQCPGGMVLDASCYVDSRRCRAGDCYNETEPPPVPEPGHRFESFSMAPACGYLEPGAAPVVGRGMTALAGIELAKGSPLLTASCGGWFVPITVETWRPAGEPFLAINTNLRHRDDSRPSLPLVFQLDGPKPRVRGTVQRISLWLAGGEYGRGKSVLVRAWRGGTLLAARTVLLQPAFQIVGMEAPEATRITIDRAGEPKADIVLVTRLQADRD